jgi:hypothetical protein
LRTHVAADFVDKIDRACDVRVEHIACVLEILIEERLAKPSTGIGEKRIDTPPVDLFVEFVDPFQVARSACTVSTVPPSRRSSSAALLISVSLATISRSNLCFAHSRASSRPMPVDAPVTTANLD